MAAPRAEGRLADPALLAHLHGVSSPTILPWGILLQVPHSLLLQSVSSHNKSFGLAHRMAL